MSLVGAQWFLAMMDDRVRFRIGDHLFVLILLSVYKHFSLYPLLAFI